MDCKPILLMQLGCPLWPVSSRGDGAGLCSTRSGSASLMRSCLLLSHQYFAIMCSPDAADRLRLSSETQINSNRAISPSLGISVCGRICLRSSAWLGARAVPGNGLATLGGFYGACSSAMGRGGRRKSFGYVPKEKNLVCHGEAGDLGAEVLGAEGLLGEPE